MFKPHVTVACVIFYAAGKFWWSKRPSTAKAMEPAGGHLDQADEERW